MNSSTSDQYSLLPNSRYDSSNRLTMLREMTSFYITKKEIQEEEVDIAKVDFFIESHKYFSMKEQEFKYKTWIMRCFFLFCKDVKREMQVDFMMMEYRGKQHLIPITILYSFLYHRVYMTGETGGVEVDYEMRIRRVIDLIPARKEVVDGQMKIAVDAILAVDDLEVKENQKVLIVGSSHEPGVVPRSSYYPLFFMLKKSEIHMYDMFEEAGEEEINTNKIIRRRVPYDYKNMLDYDLILDDVWIQGKTYLELQVLPHIQIRSKWQYKYPRNYSLKIFDRIVLGNYYHQVGKTDVGEMRLVSRSIIPDYRDHVLLGKCSFCRELKYFLQFQYNDDFYEAILHCHKEVNNKCYPDQWWYKKNSDIKKRYLRKNVKWKLSAEEFKMISGRIEIRGKEVVRLLIDVVLNNRIVEHREEHLRSVNLVVSSDDYVTQSVVDNVKQLYKYEQGILYEMVLESYEGTIHTDETIDYVVGELKMSREIRQGRKEHVNRLMHQSQVDVYTVLGPDVVWKTSQKMMHELDSRLLLNAQRIEEKRYGYGEE